MKDPELVFQRYTAERYGDLIVSEKPYFDATTKTWEAVLRSTYPRIIRDDKSEEVVVRFLNLTDLGFVRFSDNLEVMDATSDEEAERRLIDRIDIWKRRAEQIVISAEADVFARIAEGSHVLNPLIKILHVLTQQEHGSSLIFDKEIFEQDRPERIIQYLDLLVELRLIRRVEKGYGYDNMYAMLHDKIGNDSRQLRDSILSYVIKNKYSTLRQVFEIRQLEPFVHLANTYYWPSLDAEKLMRTTRSRLYQRYQSYYDGMTSWDFMLKLGNLIEQGAIMEENGYLIGNKDQFDEMLAMKPSVDALVNP